MVSLVSFINNLKNDITTSENQDSCKKFFFKSIMHLMVSLEIASSNILDEKINYNKLKLSIPSSLGKEGELQNVLKQGIKKKFFIEKKTFKNNEIHYKISKKFSLMITNWYLENKSKFN